MTSKQIKDKHIIICVDVALVKTGIAVMSGMSVIHGEVFSVKESLPYLQKLDAILIFFTEFFDNILAMEPASVELVLEGRLKRGFSGSTLASIEGARVTTYHAFHASLMRSEKYEQKVSIYSPDVVKSFFTGRANASKDAMLAAAYSRFSSLSKLKFQNDIFDAIYLGVYHLENGRSGKELRETAKQRKRVHNVETEKTRKEPRGNTRQRKGVSRAKPHSNR